MPKSTPIGSISSRNPEDVHVLSFDGGGARGVMELRHLDHIMNLTTVMVRNPKHVITLLDMIDSPYAHTIAKSLIENLEGDAIHPVEAFQYIVGKCFFGLNWE